MLEGKSSCEEGIVWYRRLVCGLVCICIGPTPRCSATVEVGRESDTSTGNETIEVEIEVDGQVSTLIDLRHTVGILELKVKRLRVLPAMV
jgi:hypothetical protein